MPQLAQINIARFRTEPEDPINQEFFDNIDRINAIAEASPGFVWRLKDEEAENATSIDLFNDHRMVVNMSVWSSVDAFLSYIYKSDHAQIMAKRKLWFEDIALPHLAIWWVEEGQLPTAEQGRQMIERLHREGPSEVVFGMRELMQRFKK